MDRNRESKYSILVMTLMIKRRQHQFFLAMMESFWHLEMML